MYISRGCENCTSTLLGDSSNVQTAAVCPLLHFFLSSDCVKRVPAHFFCVLDYCPKSLRQYTEIVTYSLVNDFQSYTLPLVVFHVVYYLQVSSAMPHT